MGDLLATALSDAGIGFDPEATASTSNNNSVQEMPPLKIMPNSSDVPSSSNVNVRNYNQTFGKQTITKPLAVIKQDTVRSTTTHRISYQPPQIQRTVVTSNGRRFIVIGPQSSVMNQRSPVLRPQQNNNQLMMRANFTAMPMRKAENPPTPATRFVRQMIQPPRQAQSPVNHQFNKPVTQPTKKAIVQPSQQQNNGNRQTETKYAEMNKESNPEDLEEDEKLIQVDTFIEYTPMKLRSGMQHPDPVVETASLNSVSSPEIRYSMSVPEEIIDSGKISALQLEAALYACQAHEKILPSGERVGYLIGDGAGVGKGRTIATVIHENYLMGRRRAIWISVSADLYYDAKRDLRDIGVDIEVHQFSRVKTGSKVSDSVNGNIKKGVLFSTYSLLSKNASKNQSRLNQLIQWFGEEFDGVIIFDECHHAKNLSPTGGMKSTATGKAVLQLQNLLPNARVIYASATGASKPDDMAYMTRLGLWGKGQTFPDFNSFLTSVENKGTGCIELIAIDMKLRGLYLARQLSFAGVEFNVQEVFLSNEFIHMYDEAVKLWMEVYRQFHYAFNHTRGDDNNRTWSNFWSAHQRFFKALCIGAKVHECVLIARQALDDGKCVVIGLQSTGEAQVEQLRREGNEVTEFVSTTKAILHNLVENYFPTGDSTSEDIFEDMNMMHNIGDRKRHLNGNQIGMPRIKRRVHRNSTGSPNEDEESTENEDNENSDTNSDESENRDNDSDSSEDSDFDDLDVSKGSFGTKSTNILNNNNADDGLFKTLMGELEEQDVEVDPFHHDFGSAVDPWAHLQTQREEILTGEQELVEKKRRERAIRKQLRQERKEEVMKQRKLEEARKRQAAIMLQRQQDLKFTTASAFIESTRMIENKLETGESVSLMTIKTELLAAIERLGRLLPPNTLDQLIDELGGSECVAEMTGRKGRIVSLPNGQVEYQRRNATSDASLEQMNMEEKECFMKGEKLIAVISEAASSGISLQSDRRVLNQRRRVHITLELPWSADKAVQQFGRTHRSNQVNAPEYLFLISELAGEKRFASTVAKRLECLGALTHGDRRAAETRDLSQFNLDNKYGRDAMQELIRTMADTTMKPRIPPPTDYPLGADKFFSDMRQYLVGVGVLGQNKSNPAKYLIEKAGNLLATVLNRLLGLPVHAQNALFAYFTSINNALIRQAKANGTFDKGILDLGSGTDSAKKLEQRVFRGFPGNPNFVVEIHKIGAERGFKWTNAKSMYDAQTDQSCGFFLARALPDRKQTIVMVINVGRSSARTYCTVRPNTGRSNKLMTYMEINEKFTRITVEDAEKEWKHQYEEFGRVCMHRFISGSCQKEEKSEFCEFGRRLRTYFILTGSVIAVWPMLEKALQETYFKNQLSHMQIVRIRTEDNQKLVGLYIIPSHVKIFLTTLTKLSNTNS